MIDSVSSSPPVRGPLAGLRRFAARKTDLEHCELCNAPLAPEHRHMIDVKACRMVCTCDPCSILFADRTDGRFRPVPPLIQAMPDLQLSDGQWESLHIPISLAFFFHSTTQGSVVAMYPSPAGATQSLLPAEAWDALLLENPELADLSPDVEALLINRTGNQHQYFRVSIDECFRLVGLLRTHWRGLSGGTEVWREINSFFKSLAERARPRRGEKLKRGPNA